MDLAKIINENAHILASKKRRDYIGASSIGHECLRKIWYDYKGEPKDFAPRTHLTFALGHAIESILKYILLKSDITVVIDKQQKPKTYSAQNIDELKGHVDGFIISGNDKYVLEVKSAKNSEYKNFVRKGLQLWKYNYYLQVQCYMGMTYCDKAILLCFNKDTSEVHAEEIEYEPALYEVCQDKARKIKYYEEEPPRISDTPMFFLCKMCPYKKTCHK